MIRHEHGSVTSLALLENYDRPTKRTHRRTWGFRGKLLKKVHNDLMNEAIRVLSCASLFEMIRHDSCLRKILLLLHVFALPTAYKSKKTSNLDPKVQLITGDVASL